MQTKIAVVNYDSILGDVDANLEKMERYAASAASQGAGLIIFPETGTTGYFIGEKIAQLAEEVPGPTTKRLGSVAHDFNLYLVTGMVEKAGGRYYNSSVMLSPEGKLVGHYRKIHLFSAEKAVFDSGSQATLVKTDFGLVGMTICYDMVFPEYIRSLRLRGADLIVNSTDWITNDWQTGKGWGGEVVSHMAATRALENTMHVAMGSRVGLEEGWKSLGHSCVCAPSGGFVARIEDGEGMVVGTVELDSPEWETWRSVATYLPDRQLDVYDQIYPERGITA